MNDPIAAPPSSLIVVTGMSGAGKSVALHTLEDLDHYCVDNLPAELLPEFVRTASHSERKNQKLAVGIDVRSRGDLANIPHWLSTVGVLGLEPKLVFFDTSDEALIKRYSDTRRRHPLSRHELPLADSIALERKMLQPLRAIADIVIDTSELNVHQLRRRIINEFDLNQDASLSLLFESFAYRHGVPADADFVFDARVLPNPHWNLQLRPLSGRDRLVREFMETREDVNLYVQQVSQFLAHWLPKVRTDTRSYVTVAFGCTGGRHRSVYLAQKMAQIARAQGWSEEVAIAHRELD